MNGDHCYFSSAPQSERLKRLSWSLHTCTSGELRFNDLLLWSSWANVAISGKLDIYDTLFQDQREKVSQTFSFQPSQAVKEIAAGWLSPHYTSSQWNAAFSLPGVTAESCLLWPFARGHAALRARDLAHCSPGNGTSPGPGIHSTQSLRSFHSAFTMLPWVCRSLTHLSNPQVPDVWDLPSRRLVLVHNW